MNDQLSHLDEKGSPSMVDVGKKSMSQRRAHARAVVHLPKDVSVLLMQDEIQTKKGPVFQTANLAGVMGAKRTPDLIPLCHPIGLDKCKIEITTPRPTEVWIDCIVEVEAKTGVEMEALTGASIAALTIYDMCKALSHDIVIKEIKLMEKSGGKRDFSRTS
ncbi:MAG: cyclic pyranopterin monophosphate synthase MoaC [Saprospiraceae bacterium]|nr:cyclic pyranopterin monophosphate synthase MoaC [Saprospiraceae bacterium]